MNIIEITPENIQTEHICCAISATPDARRCAEAKKNWMAACFKDGYHFQKLDANGKVFIEYTPAQRAWAPLEADNWLYLDCFWVSGQYKGRGIANQLLQKALDHAQENNMAGLVALSSDKKRPFLSDPVYFKHKGFVVADAAPPFYELLAFPLVPGAPLPTFKTHLKSPVIPEQVGFSVYYTDHCPHTSKYVPLLRAVAEKKAVPFAVHKIESTQTAQAAPNPFTTYALFYNGQFVTNEIFSEPKFAKFIDSL